MSSIDEKKKENESKNDSSNKQLSLIIAIAFQVLHLGIIIVIGAGMLYTCRGAQTNLFPTCVDFAPYTNILPTFAKENIETNVIETNVNITKGENGNTSTKMTFSVNENMEMMTNKSFFSWIRNFIDGPKANHIGLYFGSIMQNILALNFTILNSIYQAINNFLPETLIILILPYITFFIYFGLAFVDGFYFFYLWFSNLSMFCSIKKDTNDPTKTVWEHSEGAIWNFVNWWKIIAAFFLLLFGVTFFFSIPFIFIGVIYSFILPLTLKTNVEGKKEYGPVSLFKDVLKFKRNIIMFILSYFLIGDIASTFGSPALVSAIIICIGLYFFTGIYHSYVPKPEDGVTSGLASYDQTEKTCIIKNSFSQNIDSSPMLKVPSIDTTKVVPPIEIKGGGWKDRSKKDGM